MNPKRRIGFEEAREIFTHPYYEDRKSDDPEQFRAIGWANGKLYSLIFEMRHDKAGEYYHLVTLWKSTSEEEKIYEENIKKDRP
ncbi:MAG: BrnT family toxin [Spirochaetales bacterium]|nr:BrnT family toxin [Spirochaetales bacterium]